MEKNDQSHNRDRDDQLKGMHVDGKLKVACTPSSSRELVAPPWPSSVAVAEFPFKIPIGFTFVPTDQELIIHYLKPKVTGDPIPVSDIFADVDLYKFDPRTLIENRKGAGIDEDEWYFFTPRDRKYQCGSRPNRCSPGGFWRVTRKESVVRMENKTIGYKNSLAFYRGDSKRQGDRTALNMHEYRLKEDEKRDRPSIGGKKGVKDKRLDEWVLCKVYTPRHAKHPKNGQKSDVPPKKRNEQNLDQPDGHNAPTTTGKKSDHPLKKRNGQNLDQPNGGGHNAALTAGKKSVLPTKKRSKQKLGQSDGIGHNAPSTAGQKSEVPLKKRNEQNLDKPDRDGDNASTTASKKSASLTCGPAGRKSQASYSAAHQQFSS
ncbi:NAC domain-containing protein 68 [Eucalyptus grandis]|uniref:NAC domain-containing protein 68 n=1 Tax=Eucalyptus grandis TaxID=71139 RepID=UPI00192F0755|nr:NAC domain-containing protein 68 [Eucalyptus grandis]